MWIVTDKPFQHTSIDSLVDFNETIIFMSTVNTVWLCCLQLACKVQTCNFNVECNLDVVRVSEVSKSVDTDLYLIFFILNKLWFHFFFFFFFWSRPVYLAILFF